jgi:dTDP-4-dehydrorhamnose reductase
MLAQELLPCLSRAGFCAIGRGRPEVDLTRATSIQQTLVEVQPDIVVNTAAYTAVDRAESEPDLAFAVNRDGPASLAAACRAGGIPLIHLSTDFVFAGTATRPYREEALVQPLNRYGQSKWEGEEAVRSRHRKHVIVRTAWLYGYHGSNFVKTILRLARERETLQVVADQWGCPTWSRDLAQGLVTICQQMRQSPSRIPWGTYHLCGSGQTTWHGLACAVVAAAQAFEPLAVQDVRPIPTAAYPTSARRPAYSVLDCGKIRAAFGIVAPPWHDSLHACMQEFSV